MEPHEGDHPKCQAQVVAMGGGHLKSEHIMGQTFSSFEYDNCGALTHVPES